MLLQMRGTTNSTGLITGFAKLALHICQGRSSSSVSATPKKGNGKQDSGPVSQRQQEGMALKNQSSGVDTKSRSRSPKVKKGDGKRPKAKNNWEAKQHFKTSLRSQTSSRQRVQISTCIGTVNKAVEGFKVVPAKQQVAKEGMCARCVGGNRPFEKCGAPRVDPRSSLHVQFQRQLTFLQSSRVKKSCDDAMGCSQSARRKGR